MLAQKQTCLVSTKNVQVYVHLVPTYSAALTYMDDGVYLNCDTMILKAPRSAVFFIQYIW